MSEKINEKKQEILEDVIGEEIDFVAYVEVAAEEFHILTAREECQRLLSSEGDYTEVLKRGVSMYIHPEDRKYCMRQLKLPVMLQALEGRERIVVPYRVLCGEKYRRKELHIYYYRHDRNVLILVRRDITDSFEEEQRQRERLYAALIDARQSNQEKNEFLERMSHEIRTPMNSIIGLSYLTREHADDRNQVLENLEKITMSAHFLLSFINDILNLSQIESGNIAPNQENINFEEFLEGLRKVTAERADKKQISFTMEKSGAFDCEYCFAAEMLRKALYNILENAVKFTMPEGCVSFRAELLSETPEAAVIRFVVEDDGIGIGKSFLPYVFDAFEQEDNRSTTLNGGTGLGLAITRNIIDFMNGKIEVTSEKGKGSVFTVTVSVAKTKATGAGMRRQNGSRALDYDFTGKRALLVEDDDFNVEITRNILSHKNFAVEVASNGKEGVSMFLGHEPGYYDVILMDIRMPVMDGLTAAGEIRRTDREDGREIPIVAMTANAFEEDVRKSFEVGMDAHLSKPVDIRQMYALLDDMLCR